MSMLTTSTKLSYSTLTGDAIQPVVEQIGRIRIEVFRGYPYLYDADTPNEWRYLQQFHGYRGAVVVAARDSGRLVGVSMGTLLSQHAIDFGKPFIERGYALDKVFYCADSALLPAYRGHGAGTAFFERREAWARELGCTASVFCRIERPADDPARPAGYVPMDNFWRKLGYAPFEGVTSTYHWNDLPTESETPHPLQFWIKHF